MHLFPVVKDLSRIRPIKPGDDLPERALPGPVLTDKRVARTPCHVHRNVRKRLNSRKALGNVPNRKNRAFFHPAYLLGFKYCGGTVIPQSCSCLAQLAKVPLSISGSGILFITGTSCFKIIFFTMIPTDVYPQS